MNRLVPLAALLICAAATLFPAAPALAQEGVEHSVLVVSRTRILTETVAARTLREDEAALRQRLKNWAEAEKRALEEDEQRLTNLRTEIPKEEFDKLAGEFEQKVRTIRRDTQRFDAAIQANFRDARKELLKNLYPILIEVLRKYNADLIIDADQILIADPGVEVTDEVISLYDERVVPPKLDPIDLPELGKSEPATGNTVTSE
ncbi:OmpH family outer membrane protein [Rhodobacteraceae bacterium NNCM2]|nr:OmpH family outer membrane protein [Coraliihabitans acroporae]